MIKIRFIFLIIYINILKKNLNSFRLSIISEINSSQEYKKLVHLIGKKFIDMIVGNELAIQKNLNLSIQLPRDETSLLNIHADTFSGESPFSGCFMDTFS